MADSIRAAGSCAVAERFVIRPATREDARQIAPLLRDKDVKEIEVASGYPPEVALLFAFDAAGSEIVVAQTASSREPILIGGVCPSHPKAATIWMVGTPLLEQYALPSVREARRWIDRWHRRYPLLWNQALESNELHVRWLRLLGFNFIRRLDRGGSTFIEFAKHV